jgi:hypothetical protein
MTSEVGGWADLLAAHDNAQHVSGSQLHVELGDEEAARCVLKRTGRVGVPDREYG